MDVNWYAAEIMVQETLHAQRAKAEVAGLAANARQYRTRRRIGAVLIRLGRALVGEANASVSEQTAPCKASDRRGSPTTPSPRRGRVSSRSAAADR